MYRKAVLKIYYKDRFGKLHAEAQGKFFYLDNDEKRPVYLADMTEAKWWRNYGGYSIAKQLLDAFSKAKLRVKIIYRVRKEGRYYTANMTMFKKKGVLVPFGGHDQYVLPIDKWQVEAGNINDPHDLPVMTISEWLKSQYQPKYYIPSDRENSVMEVSKEEYEKYYSKNGGLPEEAPIDMGGFQHV